MKELKPGAIIETNKGIYIILDRDTPEESYMCIKTAFKDFNSMEYEEILDKEINGFSNF